MKMSKDKSMRNLTAIVGLGLLLAPAQAALIGQWTFNEGSGSTALDSSVNSNDGAIVGGAPYVSTGANNFGLSLDQTGSQYVEIPASPLWNPQGGDFSVLAWLSLSNGSGGPIGNDKGVVGTPTRVWAPAAACHSRRARPTSCARNGRPPRDPGHRPPLPRGWRGS